MRYRFVRRPYPLIAISLLSLLALALSGCGALQSVGATNTMYLPTNLARSTPNAQTFDGCPPQGQGGDPALNTLLNRQDDAPANGYRVTDLTVLMNLPVTPQVEGKSRDMWSSADAKRVAAYEGSPIRTTGWVVAARKAGPTPANCDSDANRTWYLWIGTGAGDALNTTMVVEVTPPVKSGRPGWTDYTMRRLIGQVVRVSGWLVYDQEAPSLVSANRTTTWEIAPVMHLETLYQNQWMNLDLLPFGARVSGTPTTATPATGAPATTPTVTPGS